VITVVHLVAGLGMLVVVPLGLGLTAVPGIGTVRRYWWYGVANATGFGLCGVWPGNAYAGPRSARPAQCEHATRPTGRPAPQL
jgi:hypothetical protein